jgi:hypothetical protein
MLMQGRNGTVSVRVRSKDGSPVAGAEVTLLVVNKAVLDLLPYPLQNVSTALNPASVPNFVIADFNAYRTSRAALNITFATLRRRLERDPWLPVDTQVRAWRRRQASCARDVCVSCRVCVPHMLAVLPHAPLIHTHTHTWGD